MVKKVVIRSSSDSKAPFRVLNIRIFAGLVRELRVKFDVFRAGLGPERIIRKLNFGLEIGKSDIYKESKPHDVF